MAVVGWVGGAYSKKIHKYALMNALKIVRFGFC
jgi:hypothetical protein